MSDREIIILMHLREESLAELDLLDTRCSRSLGKTAIEMFVHRVHY